MLNAHDLFHEAEDEARDAIEARFGAGAEDAYDLPEIVWGAYDDDGVVLSPRVGEAGFWRVVAANRLV